MSDDERATADAQATEAAQSRPGHDRRTGDRTGRFRQQRGRSSTTNWRPTSPRRPKPPSRWTKWRPNRRRSRQIATENAAPAPMRRPPPAAAQERSPPARPMPERPRPRAKRLPSRSPMRKQPVTRCRSVDRCRGDRGGIRPAGDRCAGHRRPAGRGRPGHRGGTQEQVQFNSLDPARAVSHLPGRCSTACSPATMMRSTTRDPSSIVRCHRTSNGENCRIGFVNINSGAGSVGQGVQVSEAIAGHHPVRVSRSCFPSQPTAVRRNSPASRSPDRCRVARPGRTAALPEQRCEPAG